MNAIFSDITETIGYTPLVQINKLGSGQARILIKLELQNPSGSVKDRIAVSMIKVAEKAGLITDKTVIIEPTSGNTGIGLACVCAARGYRLILTMPSSMSIERRKVLLQLGAELVLTDPKDGMSGAIKQAQELANQYEVSFIPQQFENPANPKAHYQGTAREIWADTAGEIDILVAGVGTGGTLTGCGEYLRTKKDDLKIVAVEPADSAVLSGGKAGPHAIQGIGAGFVPSVLNVDIIDEIITVSGKEAIDTAKQLAKKEGILAGISSGANMIAAMKLSERPENAGKTIVTFACDRAGRYVSTDLFEHDDPNR